MAVPEGQEENRAALFGDELPDLPPTERVADIWRELGRARQSINGPAPFEWAELQAFSALSGIALHPAEAACLVDMSREFSLEIAERNPLRKSPMERDL